MKYEKESDRENQRAIALEIAGLFGLSDLKETGEFAPFDFEAKAPVSIEVKSRNISVNDYDTIFIPRSKHEKARGSRTPVYFVVAYSDAYAVWDIRVQPAYWSPQPRKDRPEDDPVVEYFVDSAICIFERSAKIPTASTQ